jgi:chain length determinant protein tyrosine kinase EpsG
VEPNDIRRSPNTRGRVVRGEASIGSILVQEGRLSREDAERILKLQREQGLRFGDAAIQLGLLTPADIEFALSCQFDHSYLMHGQSNVSPSVVTAYTPQDPQAQAISALRTQLMLGWYDNDTSGKSLAIISAERGEGRSYVAANLAVAFSQLGLKTLLIDADMRNPRQHTLFGLDNRNGLSAMLSGRGGGNAVQPIDGLYNLAVLTTGALPPNPLELLARPLFSQLLTELEQDYEVILIDSPPSSEYPDAQTIAVRAAATLIVARKHTSRAWKVRGVSNAINHASANVIGTVLNDF